MPNWKTHLGAGIVCAVITVVLMHYFSISALWFRPNTVILLALIIFTASLFPDLDIRNSKIFGVFLGVCVAIILISFLRSYMFLGIVTTLALGAFSFLQHRGVLHSLSVLGLTTLLVYALTTMPALAMIWAVCYGSHLILDKEIKLV